MQELEDTEPNSRTLDSISISTAENIYLGCHRGTTDDDR